MAKESDSTRMSAPSAVTKEEQVLQVAQVLSLLVAEKKSDCFGASHSQKPGKSKPYEAQLSRSGKDVHLRGFATAEEAVRSPEGRLVGAQRASAPLTSEEALQQAQAEGRQLLVAKGKTGYFGVSLDKRGRAKPYKAQLKRGCGMVNLGCFATAEEAALCIARTPEGQAAAAVPPPVPLLRRSEEALRQAQAEGLTLRVATNKAGYLGVTTFERLGKTKPFQARVTRGGKVVSLGHFVTAEEAALCIARPNQQPSQRQAMAAEESAAEARNAAAIKALPAPAEGLALLEEAARLCVARSPEVQVVATVDVVEGSADDNLDRSKRQRTTWPS